MVKVTVLDSPTEAHLVVEGDLAGPVVKELEAIWKQVRAGETDRRIVVDLSGTTLIDAGGKEVLIAMAEGGAELVGKGVYTEYLVESLVRRARRAGCRF